MLDFYVKLEGKGRKYGEDIMVGENTHIRVIYHKRQKDALALET